MIKYTPYLLKNLLGYRVRTLMTVAGTALLLFLFLFVASIQQGLERLLTSADDRLIVFQAYRFCPSSSQLPLYYEESLRGIPGVQEVLPVKVVVNNCRASLDTVVFHGVPPRTLARARPGFQLLTGDWAGFFARTDAALVGRRIAERRQLQVGQAFTVAGITVTVAGVFTAEETAEENVIFTHLDLLMNQQHHDERHVTLFEVSLHDAQQADSVAGAMDAKVRDRFQVPTETKPQKAHFRHALADLLDLVGMTRWLGLVCVGVVVVLVTNSVVMAAQDRVREHAVLQTLGYSGPRILSLMLAESMAISLAGGILGTAGCVSWLLWKPLTLATEGVSIDFLATPDLAGLGLGLSAGVGLAAGLIPAWQASRREIVASLR